MTTQEIINIASISQYLAANAYANGGLYGGGVDRLLARKLFNIRKDIEWMLDIDPTNETLVATANYLYALCAPFSGEAAIIAATSTGGIIVNPTSGQLVNLADISLEFELGVTASPVVVNGINVTLPVDGASSMTIPLPNILQGTLLLTVGGTPQPTIITTNSTYTTIGYTTSQATITLGPSGTTFVNGNTYLISGLQIIST